MDAQYILSKIIVNLLLMKEHTNPSTRNLTRMRNELEPIRREKAILPF